MFGVSDSVFLFIPSGVGPGDSKGSRVSGVAFEGNWPLVGRGGTVGISLGSSDSPFRFAFLTEGAGDPVAKDVTVCVGSEDGDTDGELAAKEGLLLWKEMVPLIDGSFDWGSKGGSACCGRSDGPAETTKDGEPVGSTGMLDGPSFEIFEGSWEIKLLAMEGVGA